MFILRRAVLAAAVVLTGSVLAPRAWAQLDVGGLVGYAVSNVDSRFADVEAAIVRFRNGDIAGARELLDGVRQRVPELPPTDVTLAKMYLASNQEAPGRAALDAAATRSPDDPEAFVMLGDFDLQQGHNTGAALLYEKGLDLAEALEDAVKRRRSLVVRASSGLANIAEQREDWKTADAVLQKWLAETPTETAALRRLGRAQFMLEQYQEAYASFNRARELDPTLSGGDATIGRLYSQAGNEARAKQFMDRAMQADANNLGTLLNYAQWSLDTQQFDQAETALAAAKRLDSTSIEAVLLSGVLARLQGNLDQAQQRLEQAHLLDPTNFNVMNQLAQVLISQSDAAKRDKAVKYAELNARNYRQSSEAGVTLAWVYYQTGRSAEAQQVLNAAVQLGGLNPDSSYLVAKMLYDTGKHAEAARLLESATAAKSLFIHREPAEALLKVIRGEPGGAR